jgi:hypothetical protein
VSGYRRARRGNGRFTQATTENTFGLHLSVCPNPDCRRFNPYSVGEKKPEVCHACGKPLGSGHGQ